MKRVADFLIAAMLLLTASVGRAQTVPAVQNAGFDQPATMENAFSGGPYSIAPIAGWNVSGSAGLWQPTSAEFATLPNGTNVAWSNGGTISQDLGAPAQASVTYSLSVAVGHRGDNYGATTYTIQLLAGATVLCSATGKVADIPLGTFATDTLICPVPAVAPTGNLVIALVGAGAQADFDNVIFGIAPPLALQLVGCCTLSFPVANLSQVPSCTAADGTCSIAIKACDTANPPNCITSSLGQISLVKTASLPTPSILVVPVVTATAPIP